MGRTMMILSRYAFPAATAALPASDRGDFTESTYQNYVIKSREGLFNTKEIEEILKERGIQLGHVGQVTESAEKPQFDISIRSACNDGLSSVVEKLAQLNCQMVKAPIVDIDWYPRTLRDFDSACGALLNFGDHRGKDSAQFTDQEYRKRRDAITEVSKDYRFGEPIPIIEYTPTEQETWRYCYSQLRKLHKQAMVPNFEGQISQFQKALNVSQKIPQLRDLNEYLLSTTGFRLKPIHGIVNQRDSLYALAHRVFYSTQYIRHSSKRDYTEEPDVLHDIVGHVSMLADPEIADLSHQLGLLSLGATDQQIKQIGCAYWFTIEFGAVPDGNNFRTYGAGIAGSVGQLRHFLSKKARFVPFQLDKYIDEPFTVQSVQPEYKYTKSLEDVFKLLKGLGKKLRKVAEVKYDPIAQSFFANREVRASFKRRDGPFV